MNKLSLQIVENKHFNNRRRGFYFWTTKKNFLSCYIFSNYLKNNRLIHTNESLYFWFFKIFKNVLYKIKEENNFELKRKFINDWQNYNFKYISFSKNYNNEIICFLKNLYPKNILDFLYEKKWSIEDLFVYLDIIEDDEILFKTALKIFTTYVEIIDNYNSHYSKIYLEYVAYPLYSLNSHYKIYRNWHNFL